VCVWCVCRMKRGRGRGTGFCGPHRSAGIARGWRRHVVDGEVVKKQKRL
jgi:hypothetical protein